jgi:hypothetical protein
LRQGHFAPRNSDVSLRVARVARLYVLSGLVIPSAALVAQKAPLTGSMPRHVVQEPSSSEAPKSFEQPEGTPNSWADAAIANELKVIDRQGQVPLRFRQRKVDAKGDTTREVIESKDGNVARMVERDGQPLTAAEDAAERDRLAGDIASPDDFLRHHKREDANRDDVLQLVRMMPKAMIYSYAPGQPQSKAQEGQEVVLDFHPNPEFRPPTMYA